MNATILKQIVYFFAAFLVAAGFSFTFGAPNALASFTVSISTDGNGTISGIVSGIPPTIIPATTSASVPVGNGKSASFFFSAQSGYEIADVLVDGSSVGTPANYLFPSSTTGTPTLSVSFALIGPYTITASAGANGSISPSGAVLVDVVDTQIFAIVPSAGFSVADVLVDGASVGAVTSYMFPAFSSGTTDHTISVSFAQNIYTITASAGANGSMSPSGAVSVNGTANQAFSITPASGFSVADVLVDGASVGAVTSYTFTNVLADHTIAVSFAATTHTITASADANGSVSPSGAVAVNEGTDQAFTITAVNGYHIADVLVDGVSVGAVGSHTFTNVIADHTISATFAANQTSGGGGGGGYALPPPGRSTAPTPVVTPPVTPPVVVVPPVVVAPVAETPVVVIPEVLTSTLALGARGGDVIALQNRLIAEGLLHTSATGYFGPFTESAVKAYQVKYGIPALGIVGPLTRAEFLKPVGHDAPVNTALVVNTSAATPAVEETVAAEGATDALASLEPAVAPDAEFATAAVVDARTDGGGSVLAATAMAFSNTVDAAVNVVTKIVTALFSFWK